MSSVAIRSYQPEDLSRILELTVEGFQGVSIDHLMEQQFGFVEPGWQERKLCDMRQTIMAGPEGVFVAVRDEHVLGFVTVVISEPKSIGRIADLVVDAQERNQGIGRQLLNAALTYIKERGMSFAKIETLDVNPVGQALYPKLGFKEVARQIHYVMPLS